MFLRGQCASFLLPALYKEAPSVPIHTGDMTDQLNNLQLPKADEGRYCSFICNSSEICGLKSYSRFPSETILPYILSLESLFTPSHQDVNRLPVAHPRAISTFPIANTPRYITHNWKSFSQVRKFSLQNGA